MSDTKYVGYVVDLSTADFPDPAPRPAGYGGVNFLVAGSGSTKTAKVALVSVQGQGMLVCRIDGLKDGGASVKIGDGVFIAGNGVVTGKASFAIRPGRVFQVAEPKRGGRLVVEEGPQRFFVACPPDLDPRAGESVVVDQLMSVVLGRADIGVGAKFSIDEAPETRWEDVAGYDDVKRELVEAVVWPVTKKELLERHGRKMPRGILLWGPPGNGKTMLARATARAFVESRGSDAAGGLFWVKGPEMLDKWQGNTEAAIRNLFADARAYRKRTGFPGVVVLDEADAVLRSRESGHFMQFERTVVPTFLAEMDGFERGSAVVLLLTNRPEALDPAVVRDGRVDARVKVGRPDRATASKIVAAALPFSNVKLETHVLADDVVDAVWRESAATQIARVNVGKGVEHLYLRDAVSGALLVGVVERALRSAFRREVELGGLALEGDGQVKWGDFEASIAEAARSLRATNLTEVAVEKFGDREPGRVVLA